MNNAFRIAAAALIVLGAAACTKKQDVKTTGGNDTAPVAQTTPAESNGRYVRGESLETDACLRQRVVYFDFDRSEIRPEFQAQVACHAEYLRQFSDARVTLEGHADERGTREYNLGLGERRGNALQGALNAAGASGSQLNVVSYGKERPVCKEHNEGCWSKNRRVEIIYTAK